MLELTLLLVCYSPLFDAAHVVHGALPVLVEAQACLCTKPCRVLADKLGKIKICWCHLALNVVYSLSISMQATHFISWKETFL